MFGIQKLLKQILKELQSIKSLMLDQRQSKLSVLPNTYILTVGTRPITADVTAGAVVHYLPASTRTGQRKTITDASLHYRSTRAATASIIGHALQSVTMSRPKRLLIRVNDEVILRNLQEEVMEFTDDWRKQGEILMQDLHLCKQLYPIEIRFIGNREREYEEVESLLDEAEQEYIELRLGKEQTDVNECNGDCKDTGRTPG